VESSYGCKVTRVDVLKQWKRIICCLYICYKFVYWQEGHAFEQCPFSPHKNSKLEIYLKLRCLHPVSCIRSS
jgi:hypothetical protein